jgi:hypothetical protein
LTFRGTELAPMNSVTSCSLYKVLSQLLQYAESARTSIASPMTFIWPKWIKYTKECPTRIFKGAYFDSKEQMLQ